MNKGVDRNEKKTAVLIFVILLSSYAYFFPRWADWNQNSRLDQAIAIVEKGVLYIDDYYQNTGDYAFFEGHYYSDKAPGTAFLGIPAYWLFRTLARTTLVSELAAHLERSSAVGDTLLRDGTGIRPAKVHDALALYVITFLTVSVPSALLGVLLYAFLAYLTPIHKFRLELTLAYGLATMAFPYSWAFIGHQIAAVSLFSSFALVFRSKVEGRSSVLRLLLVGFLLGYAVITEYPTIFAVAPLFLYSLCVLRDKWRIAWILVGSMLPALAAAIYNLSIYHTPLPVAYNYSVLFPQHFHTGFMGFRFPTPEALWGLTFSLYRGLFTLSPFLILAIPGFVIWFRAQEYRAEFLTTLASVVLLFVFISGMTTWSGNFSVGPRHLCAILPFLVVPIVFFLNRFRTWGHLVSLVLVLASLISVWVQTVSGQGFPDESVPFPLLQFSLPRFLAGDIARNVGTILGLRRWFSLVPIVVVIVGGLLWLGVSKRKPVPADH